MAGRILAAARRVGIGMTLLPVFYAHSTFGGAPPRPEQRRFVTDLSSFARLVDDCRRLIKTEEGETIGVAPHSLRAVTPERIVRTHLPGRRRLAHSHSRRRTNQGSRGLHRLGGSSSGALAARPCRRRPAMVPRPCDAHGRGRDARPRALARSRRTLSGDGSQSWRWDLQRRGLHPRGRALWRRHGLQCLDRRGCGIAPARICSEVAGAGAQCLQPPGGVIVGGRCSRRSGLAARRP